MATDKPTIGELRPGQRASLDRLWRHFFGWWSADGLAERWPWQFDDNPFARERPAENRALSVGDEVVGYLGAFPIPMRIDGECMVALCATGLVAREEHRMLAMGLVRGLTRNPPVLSTGMNPGASKLFQRFGGKLVPEMQTRYTFQLRHHGAVCNQLRTRLRRPLVPLLKPWMVGPVAPFLTPAEARPSQTLPQHGGRKADIRPVTRFDGAYEQLWSAARERFAHSLDKSAQYMNWRYLDCPTLHPVCLGHHDASGALTGLVVALPRGERDWVGGPCETHGEIAELLLAEPDRDVARALLVDAMHALDRLRVDSITATGFQPEHHAALEALGFQRAATETFAMAVNLGKGKSEVVQHGDRYFTAADGDSLFATGL